MADLFGSGALPCGSRILWEKVLSSKAFSLGFFFPSGSRTDPPGKAGLAHLVEHMVFKGTLAYSASDLARKVDRVGGDLNAWTDREEIAFTCTVPAEHWRTAGEVLVQLCFHPNFPVEELEREREVIRNEILATLEDPEEMAYESFLSLLSRGDWSRPVAGTEKSLALLTAGDVRSWHSAHLVLPSLTVVACGNLDEVSLSNDLGFHLGGVALGTATNFHLASFRTAPVCRVVPADFQMVQVLGGWHFGKPSTVREATVWQFFSMLWGETMSSRLFQSLRESRGLCYSVTSQVFDTETEWGLQFFATAAPEHGRAIAEVLREEILRLQTEPPTETEWEDARLALLGGLILGSEKMENRVGRLWHFHRSFDVRESLDTLLVNLEVPVTREEHSRVLDMVRGPCSLEIWGKTRLRSSKALETFWRR